MSYRIHKIVPRLFENPAPYIKLLPLGDVSVVIDTGADNVRHYCSVPFHQFHNNSRARLDRCIYRRSLCELLFVCDIYTYIQLNLKKANVIRNESEVLAQGD